ncbi:sulfotransferase family protein [Stenotrophomonas pictorum]|uniref:sulfotransferase family protein n=1 Tax=Stenotrophomonas pictorum TaxID=86184 RepID=UPI0006D1A4BD|nr:sulfotransferase family protein [Stenotrophomonas pictorum]
MTISETTAASVIVVLGMHRSGTSALAGTFSQLGLRLGDELMPATADANPKGYFEHVRVVQAHDRLLAAFGMDWADPRPLPESWLRHPAALRARAELEPLLAQLLAEGGTVVVKDPRACRFVPLWRELLESLGVQAHFAFIARHPVEVAASLRRRDDMSEYRAGLLSLAYQLEAEQATRGASRVFLTYEALIADWRGQVARCRHAFGAGVLPEEDMAAAAEVDGFLDAQLRNHHAVDAFALDPDVLAAYGCVVTAAGGGALDLTAMDALRQRFEAGRRGYAAAMEAALSALGHDHARHVPAWSRGLELASAWNGPVPDAAPSIAPRMYARSAAGGYCEELAVDGVVQMAAGGICNTTMDTVPGMPLERVRFDPDGRPGVYELLSVRLDGRPVPDLAGRVTILHEQRMAAAAADAIVWAAQGDDPWLELDLSNLAEAVSGARRVEFSFRRATAYALAEEGNKRRHAQQIERLEALQVQQAHLHEALEIQQRTLASQDELLCRMQAQQQHAGNELSALSRRLAAAQEQRLDAVAAQLGVLSATVMELKQRSDRPLLYRVGRKLRVSRGSRRVMAGLAVLEPLRNVAMDPDGYWCGCQRDPQFSVRMGAGPGPGIEEAGMC